ncbi:MAG: 3-isopropylmalate dehydrogenase [Rhodospirillaceae bacterium]|nr:3-isopropylmalate dehydrogenase [Rhodospirillaceae bacterium]OUT79887.1 MAG: 3-isopropylmalate dehydrogenase [Rhodospirillaceae bacterium TMED23]|tara:strand:- start:16398 stop:17465 length:1068 start_codon:yes stop_codon:yes gene_type:complete
MKIGILMGDDIGYEVVPEAIKVLSEAARISKCEVEWSSFPIGKEGHDLHGNTTPEVTVKGLKEMDGWIMGPIGHQAYPRNDSTWIMPPIRKIFDLFASIKPVKSYDNIYSLHQNVDIVFVREVTEGMQSRDTTITSESGEYRPNNEISIGSRVITRKGSNRVAREAFKIAQKRVRKKVTVAHKEAVYRLTCGMFAEECRKVAHEFPDVEFEEIHIDTIAAHLVMNPQDFDVVVTTNQFGDILTDLGAGLVGGLGLAPGLCVGDNQAMSQATHGSAPDIAGQNIANPFAIIMSGKMLLEWFGRENSDPHFQNASDIIDSAVEMVINEAKYVTRDIGGRSSTQIMGNAICEKLETNS